MPDITIDQRTYDFHFTAAIMKRPVGDAVRLLVERLDTNRLAS